MAGSTSELLWNCSALFIRELGKRRTARLLLTDARGSEIGLTDELHESARNNAALFRSAFDGPLLAALA
jgi:N-ethylmaleimide reductase